MRRLLSLALVAGFTLPLMGCFVTTRDRHHHGGRGQQARKGGCPPAYHMSGGVCVHNGKAKGHHKNKHR